MYVNGSNFFNIYVENIQSNGKAFSLIHEKLASCQEIKNTEEKVSMQRKVLESASDQLKDTKIAENLKNFKWAVCTLHPLKDGETLDAAIEALSIFANSLLFVKNHLTQLEKEEKLKELAKSNEEAVLSIFENASLQKACEAATSKQQIRIKNTSYSPLPNENALEKEFKLETSSSDLTLSTTTAPTYMESLWSSLAFSISYLSSNFIFSDQSSIPYRLANYYMDVDENNQKSRENILSLMKGKQVNTKLEPLPSEKENLAEAVKIPQAFRVDLPRLNHFTINGKNYLSKIKEERKDLQEVGRDLYRYLGREGGARLMQVCNQALMPYYLQEKILPKIMEGGEWQNLFPGESLLPTQKDGTTTNFDIQINENQQTVKVSTKIFMCLIRGEDKKGPLFIIKSEFELPIKELCRQDFNDLDDPAPNMKVKDFISHLIIDNEALAEELFDKF